MAAGALSLHDGAHLVRIRGQLMQDAAPAGVGAMAAVLGAEEALVAQVCEQVSATKVAVPANYNAPGQIVIGGDAEAVDAAIAELNARGIRKTVKLAVSVPSHTPLMREAANRLAETIQGLAWQLPTLPVVQNVDAQVHDSLQAIGQALVRQLYLPVRWTDCVQALVAAEHKVRLEIDHGELVLADPATDPTFFLRYLGEDEHAGPWRTGDRVRADADGFLYFEGRTDDVIISAGYRIGPVEVETALGSHAAVADAAVGNVAVGALVTRSGVAGAGKGLARNSSATWPGCTLTKLTATRPSSSVNTWTGVLHETSS